MASPEPIPPRLVPLRGPATAASALVAGTCLAAILNAVADWHHFAVAGDYVAGVPGIWVADLTSAEATSHTVGTLHLFALVAAGIALLVWLSRARHNGKLLHKPLDARPHLGWALGLWFAVTTVTGLAAFALRGEATMTELRDVATLISASAVLHCVTGALVLLTVRQVTRAQATPRPTQADQPA